MNYAYAVPNVPNPSSSDDYVIKGESTSASFSSSLGNQWSRFNLWGRLNYNNSWEQHKLDVTLGASREQSILTGSIIHATVSICSVMLIMFMPANILLM